MTFSKLRRYRWPLLAAGFILLGFLLPERCLIPVQKATPADWHPQSFWYYPWGPSVTHKGIDIFAPEGRPVRAATGGLVVFRGQLGRGGNVMVVLGPKWRLHYYAHLRELGRGWLSPVRRGALLGTVGTTGNAQGKPPHLHYSIFTPFPYILRWDPQAPQGWLKMFFLDPNEKLRRPA